MRSVDTKLSSVFTPNDTPTITYVERSDLQLEERLKSYCELPKMVVSISGPSKSGKTVLIKKVLSEDRIIPVIGSGIQSPDNLWDRALQWMETPTLSTRVQTTRSSVSGGVDASGEIGVGWLAKGKAGVNGQAGRSWEESKSSTSENSGLTRIIKEISDSEFVIFIDDFHYIKSELLEEIGRQIKVATDNGVKIITASVPHRTDDVVRSNPELRGRVAAFDLGYWSKEHLALIARQGFSALNIDLSPTVEYRLTEEAMGSPQLMQTICFNLCQELGVISQRESHDRVDVTEIQIDRALYQTSLFTDFTKMLSSLHSGPRTRGQERKEHRLNDGSMGDVYRSVLMAIREKPILMSFPYDELMSRIRAACVGDGPAGSSVTSCLEQMHIISENLQPSKPVIAWDGDNLDITDPYFAFFLRCSDKITSLGS